MKKYNKIYEIKIKNISIIIFLSLSILITSSFLCGFITVNGSYIPSAPKGPIIGYTSIDYEFTINTMSFDSEWMFIWGDGEYSEWMHITDTSYKITKSHNWKSEGNYEIKVKFRNNNFPKGISSNPTSITIIDYNLDKIPNAPKIPFGISHACTNSLVEFSTYSTDKNNDKLHYRFDFGDGTISNWTDSISSSQTIIFSHIWKNEGIYEIRAQSKNHLGLLSEWSKKLKINIEIDSDFDGLSDNFEEQINSNSNNPLDVINIKINNKNYYIISLSNKNYIFYNPILEFTNNIKIIDNKNLLIDENNNGKWDYIYNQAESTIINYKVTDILSFFKMHWAFFLILFIIISILCIVLILIKTGFIYIYEEEIIKEK